MQASEDDFYYFAWENTVVPGPVYGDVYFNETLYKYDVSNAIDECSSQECSFKLHSGQVVVVEAYDSGSYTIKFRKMKLLGIPDDVFQVEITEDANSANFWIILVFVIGALSVIALIVALIAKRRMLSQSYNTTTTVTSAVPVQAVPPTVPLATYPIAQPVQSPYPPQGTCDCIK